MFGGRQDTIFHPMRGLLLFVAGLLTAGASLLLARSPGTVEHLYAGGPGAWIPRMLSLATGWAPLSVSAVLLVLLLLWGGRRAWRGWTRIRSGDGSVGPALAAGLAWAGGVTGVLVLAFYLFWGLNYARAPLGERLGLSVTPAESTEALLALADHVVERTNRAYRLLHGGSEDLGEATAIPFDRRAVSRELETGWGRVSRALDLPAQASRRYGPVKTRGATAILDFFDLSGVYSPFTGEAHVSASLPSMVLPAVAAHEQAHQRGIAREDEASFAGVLAAVHADDPYVLYSGWARIARAVLRDVRRVDRDVYEARMAALLPGVRRDWGDYIRWYEENRSLAGPVATAVNDTYLRAHAVEGGVASYDRVTELLVAWAARTDGRLTVLPGTALP